MTTMVSTIDCGKMTESTKAYEKKNCQKKGNIHQKTLKNVRTAKSA